MSNSTIPTTESTSSSSIIPTTSSVPITTTSSIPPTTSSAPPTTTSIPPPETSSSPSIITSVITQTPTDPTQETSTFIVTSTAPPDTTSATSTTSSTTPSGTAGLQSGSASSGSGGLSSQGTIAVAVVVPIVAVSLIVLAGLYFWRKRKARKDAEELRRKEVEEYGYNPNNDPTLPPAGVIGGATATDGAYEMKEDNSSGYRGWGTTAVASSGHKASTTMSGPSAGGIGMAYSEGSPTNGPVSDTRSDNPLTDRPMSGEIEPLGAMGPATSGNRNGDINRGPSNASSSYSAANRSDGSGEGPGNAYYNNQYDTENPYGGDPAYGSPPGPSEMAGQPIIRDVQARRNTRIENPSHFPQQSAGISQNF